VRRRPGLPGHREWNGVYRNDAITSARRARKRTKPKLPPDRTILASGWSADRTWLPARNSHHRDRHALLLCLSSLYTSPASLTTSCPQVRQNKGYKSLDGNAETKVSSTKKSWNTTRS